MKPTTRIHILAQNIGKPGNSIQIEGPFREIYKELGKFLLNTTMAKRIDIRIARNEVDLVQARGQVEDPFSDLDAIFDSLNVDTAEES